MTLRALSRSGNAQYILRLLGPPRPAVSGLRTGCAAGAQPVQCAPFHSTLGRPVTASRSAQGSRLVLGEPRAYDARLCAFRLELQVLMRFGAVLVALGLSLGAAVAQVKVGLMVSATGPTTAIGIPQKNTGELLARRVGDASVEYIYLDDGGDNTHALQS